MGRCSRSEKAWQTLDEIPLIKNRAYEALGNRTKVYIEGHGCSASLADTEILSGLIERGGYELVDCETEADLSVLVTCSVKSVTEQRMLGRIRNLSSQCGKRVVVAGCLARAEPDKILKINPNLTLIGPGNLERIVPALETALSGRQLNATEPTRLIKLGMPRTRKNRVVGIVEIASGCLSSCTFCQVKLVKGTVFSYPESEIVSEIRNLAAHGAKEVWLTSTDNSAYGRDSKTDLAKLLRRVCEIEGDFMVRVGMMNPLLTGRMLDRLVDAFCEEKIFKFLHLPVQSGSNRILTEMQRGYTVDTYHDTVYAFRKRIPNLTLSTDIIVGFPSENEAEFEESMELLRKSRPDVVNISRFGARQGTKAALMEDQISSGLSRGRSARMTKLTKEIASSNNRSWLGWEGEILIDEIGKGALIGRNFAYKPCVLKAEKLGDGYERFVGRLFKVRVVDVTASTLRTIPIERVE